MANSVDFMEIMLHTGNIALKTLFTTSLLFIKHLAIPLLHTGRGTWCAVVDHDLPSPISRNGSESQLGLVIGNMVVAS